MIKPSPKLIISLILGRIFIWKKNAKKTQNVIVSLLHVLW